ncbi:TRAP transporter small permease [Alkalihalobacillus sp. AL-G]|uniref:TRAP transporter small permease n=1 Tax=Alkalihalobacillus sp. AL-G TaxID=2926399 RepID=UPI00272B32EA|nr:TRAP transporter small permease [Alkalihalobacillus sp. AL-G]WLD94539.1 TRAP transporter small permease [Alkalihalobacillus sp. AL-G]
MKRLWKLSTTILETFSTVLLISFFFCVLLQVFFRFVLVAPLTWTEEASRLLNMWSVFIAAALAISQAGHLRVDLIDRFLSKRGKRILDGIVALISILSIVCLFIGSVIMTKMSWSVSLTMLPLPQGIFYLGCAISTALMIIFIALSLFKANREGENG